MDGKGGGGAPYCCRNCLWLSNEETFPTISTAFGGHARHLAGEVLPSCHDCSAHSLCSLPCRVVSSSVTLPLGYVFKPVESLLVHCPKSLVDLPVVGGLLVPPVSAEAVARAAIAAATDSTFAAGVAGVDVIQRYK